MADKNMHYAVGAYAVPSSSIKSSYNNVGGSQNQTLAHEATNRQYYGDRKGTYVSTTEKSSASTGERVVNQSSGQVGYKDEYKYSQSVRLSDKASGTYTKYSVEEKYQRFSYK